VSPEERNTKDLTGFLVIAGPEDPIKPVWISEVKSRLASGSEVHLYLIDRGVLHMMEEGFLEHLREGLILYACAYGCRRYEVPLTKPAVFSGLTVLNNLITGCRDFFSVAPTRREKMGDGIVEEHRIGKHQNRGKSREIVIYTRWDPRESHLPVEGLRIASGLTVGNAALSFVMNRRSTPLLFAGPEEMIDGEGRDTYLEILERNEVVFYHEGDMPKTGGVVGSRWITKEEKEALLTRANRLIII
jgi:hypothetical protein